jgi:hypothetical protein
MHDVTGLSYSLASAYDSGLTGVPLFRQLLTNMGWNPTLLRGEICRA